MYGRVKKEISQNMKRGGRRSAKSDTGEYYLLLLAEYH
jgi:hypothetical protein